MLPWKPFQGLNGVFKEGQQRRATLLCEVVFNFDAKVPS